MRFEDIIGNDDIKLQLNIAGRAALINNTSVPHTLFTGAAGCGKTTMSKALSVYQGTNLLKIPPESMKSSKDVLDLADSLCPEGYDKSGTVIGTIKPSVVFFDEVHNMPLGGQEALGIAMEEWYAINRSPYTGQVNEYWMPRFTVVGATTLSGKLSKPFRDRFKLIFQFNTYNLEHSVAIVKKHAELKGLEITPEGALEIASRARGVPRTMVGFLERAADTVTVMGEKVITSHAVISIFNIMGVDSTGLTNSDLKLLVSLYEAGMPVGIDTLGVLLNESVATLQNSREPYLIQRGLLLRTGRGRTLSQKGIEYLRENGYIETKRRFTHG